MIKALIALSAFGLFVTLSSMDQTPQKSVSQRLMESHEKTLKKIEEEQKKWESLLHQDEPAPSPFICERMPKKEQVDVGYVSAMIDSYMQQSNKE